MACMTHLRLCSRVIQVLLHLFLHATLTTITCLPLLLHLGILPLEHLQSVSPTNVTMGLR